MMILVDVVLVNAGIILAYLIRFLGRLPGYNWHAYLAIAPWLSLAAVVLLASYDFYDERWWPAEELRQRLVPVVALMATVTILISFLLSTVGFPRSVFVLSALVQYPLLYLWRRYLTRQLYESEPTRIVFVSHVALPTLPPGLEQLGFRPEFRVCSPHNALTTPADCLVLDDTLTPAEKEQLFVAALELRIPCFWRPVGYDALVAHAKLAVYGNIPYFSLQPVHLPWIQIALKRILDVLIAGILLVLSLPLAALIALLIVLEDGRPVLYRQERITLHHQRFWLWKFRSLEKDFEMHHGPGLTLPGTPGVTRVGRVLRASHLDEIPQLWNVLRGEMSLVGPRPERPHYVESFAASLPPYLLRHQVMPGITGLAQISGDYLSPAEDKLQMDLAYTRGHTVWMDLRILLKTVLHLFKKPPGAPPSSLQG